jgi:hypothetical protein
VLEEEARLEAEAKALAKKKAQKKKWDVCFKLFL